MEQITAEKAHSMIMAACMSGSDEDVRETAEAIRDQMDTENQLFLKLYDERNKLQKRVEDQKTVIKYLLELMGEE